MSINRLPVTKGIKAMLAEATGKPGFVMKLPTDQAKIPPPPYWILYPLDIGSFTGTMADAAADAFLGYQVTSVGKDGTGAEWMADKVRTAMIGRGPDGDFLHAIDAGDGQEIMTRRPQAGAGGGGPSEDMVTIAEQFVVAVTPS